MSGLGVVIIGLPASGKTTFLAALWHLVTAREIEPALRLADLCAGDATHLHAIARRWREARVQDRTTVDQHRMVAMNLLDRSGAKVHVTFPDVAGEAYRRMWEDRECDPEIRDVLSVSGVLLFVHSDTIEAPRWIEDEIAVAQAIGVGLPEGTPLEWQPGHAPTQVQLVDLLQMLRQDPLNVGPRKLAIMLSAWDKGQGEGLAPEPFLVAKLPLLAQYLQSAADGWSFRVYGLSAQGGDYDQVDLGGAEVPDAERLRQLDAASQRIRLVRGTEASHDLTEPIEWLMS
ncbi:MAG: hypothetical protein IH627_12080 [Rubrivivax sp.]|nr:hypothetical protein [Rubrivivax sp.]